MSNERKPLPWWERPGVVATGAAWEERVAPTVAALREFYISKGLIKPEASA